MSDTQDNLLDKIYEAAVLPELWPVVLHELSAIPDAVGGILFATDLRHTQWVASDGIAPVFEKFVAEGWMERNPRPQRLAAARYAGFVVDHDYFTQEELDKEPVYVDFYRKYGVGWAAGTMLPMPTGDLLVYSFERAFEKGPVGRDAVASLDCLRPHLARSGLLAWRLGLQRAKAMASALEAVGLPAAVLKSGGAVQAANRLFEALMPRIFQDRRERLFFSDGASDAKFASSISRLRQVTAGDSVLSIPIPAKDDQSAMVVHLVPVRRAAQDVFLRASAIVVVTPVDRSAVPTAELIEALFDLTPAEARVARFIGEAKSIEEAAQQLGTSRETVRSQVKAVLGKTGLHRQAELTRLLSGLSLPNHKELGASKSEIE